MSPHLNVLVRATLAPVGRRQTPWRARVEETDVPTAHAHGNPKRSWHVMLQLVQSSWTVSCRLLDSTSQAARAACYGAVRVSRVAALARKQSVHCTLYTPHSTLYTLDLTPDTLHSTLCTLHSALYTLHSTLYTLHSTLYTPHFTLFTLHLTPYTLHFKLRTLHFIYTLYTLYIHFTLYTLHLPSFLVASLRGRRSTCWFCNLPLGSARPTTFHICH